MPQLIKNIEAVSVDILSDDITLVKSVSGQIQEEDYINMGGFVAYLQNLSRTEETYALTKPLLYGLNNARRLQIKNLNIDY
jgi:hypothetical protein